jgi:hypothetical protein
MDIGSIFLILALLIPIILFVVRPIIDHNMVHVSEPGLGLSTLLAERDHIVANIQELDDDYRLGKIPAEDYPPQRLTLLQNGAEILREIDAFQASATDQPAEDRLEDAIIAHRQALEAGHAPIRKYGNAVPPVPDDDIEQKIALRRRSMQGKAGGFCPKCGRPVQVTDQFCPRCGANLANPL